LKNDRRYCLGEWEINSLEEERDEDENDRFTKRSLFQKFVSFVLNFGRETILEKFPQNTS